MTCHVDLQCLEWRHLFFSCNYGTAYFSTIQYRTHRVLEATFDSLNGVMAKCVASLHFIVLLQKGLNAEVPMEGFSSYSELHSRTSLASAGVKRFSVCVCVCGCAVCVSPSS